MQPTSLTAQDVSYEDLAAMIDHSLLKPELTTQDILDGCALADRYKVVSVCVRPCDVSLARDALSASSVAVGTVIAFPHGDTRTSTKVFEAETALTDGAVELDMVLNIGWLIGGELDKVEADIRSVVDVSGDALVKVIFENHYLTDEQIVAACKVTEAAGADFVKTSSGYAGSGATLEDLRLMRASVS
ncbi:MAG: deoxyribose-phosphate aldolase, partial [Acidimicrobiia bacterium]